MVNFTPMKRNDYRVGVPKAGKYTLLLNSDDKKYGGTGSQIETSLKAEETPWDNQPYSVGFTLPPFGAVVLKF